MKLLIDAQLPFKLCEILEELGIDSMHVIELENGDESEDQDISTYADANNLIVVSKDSDFYHSHMILGRPEKLFLITSGNIKNKQLFDLFRNNVLLIKKALNHSNFVELSNSGIIES